MLLTEVAAMDPGQTASEFQSTAWALVVGARGDRERLEDLLRVYWSPVYGFIRRLGYGGHDASDLTQEFMSRVVVGRDLIGRADPARGRFRAFLKQALRNFLIDQHRRGVRARFVRRARGQDETQDPMERIASGDGAQALEDFDRRWAASVVEQTLQRVEDACARDGLQTHWTAFDLNVLGPAIRKTSAVSLPDLAARLGAVDADQVSNMIQTVKRKFRKLLREVVAETVREPKLVEEELAELRGLI